MTSPSTGGFDTWALPSGVVPPAGAAPEPAAIPDGLRLLHPDAGWIRGLARTLSDAAAGLRRRRAAEIARVLGRVGRRFLEDGDPLRLRALELLPATSGLSPAMASAVLDGMARDWTEERLTRLLRADFGDPAVLDGFVARDEGSVRAVGPELCVQIVSGSVPGVGATALLRALLVKAPTLLKPGLGDVVLPVLLARAVREEDEPLGDALGVVYWPGGNAELEEAALAEAEVVAAYGGDEAVRSVRSRTPVTARFVAYHHRVSVGVVGREALEREVLHRTASEVAGAAAFFDQRGCVSPHAVYVEEGGAASPAAFARELAGALGLVETHLPGGALDPHEAAALQQVRGTAELLAAAGAGVEVHHGGDASWTVVLDPDDAIGPACIGRVVRVIPVPDVGELPARLRPLGAHLQTVGLAGCGAVRSRELADALAHVGASRVTSFGDVPFPPPWWHHDGRGPLRALVRWTDLEV